LIDAIDSCTTAAPTTGPRQLSQLSRHGHGDQPQRCSRKYQAQDMLADVVGFRPEKRGAKITNKQATCPIPFPPGCRPGEWLCSKRQDLTAWSALSLRAYNEDLYPGSFFNEIKHFPLPLRVETLRETLIAA
jgi:hypothetical protein